jgi:hypothetical protein
MSDKKDTHDDPNVNSSNSKTHAQKSGAHRADHVRTWLVAERSGHMGAGRSGTEDLGSEQQALSAGRTRRRPPVVRLPLRLFVAAV